ncbi:MAG: hypothetical protein H8E45_04100 [Proteobacteria bacterium]|nr:hypothetical protein [Pseudomonadota bacterium]
MNRILNSLFALAIAVVVATPAWAQVRPELGGTGSLANTGTSTHVLIGDGNSYESNALSGDATMTNAGVVTVVDDSHAHTTTSVSGLDISADTNLAVTAPIVLTGDTVSIGGTGNPTALTGEWDFGGGGLEIENNTAIPGSCTTGQVFLDTDGTSGEQFYACEGGSFVQQGASSPTKWNAIADADGDGTVTFAEFDQILGWNSAATAAAYNAMAFQFSHDSTTDASTQEGIVIERLATTGTATFETLLTIDNQDTDGAVTTGLLLQSAAGVMTTAIDASDAEIGVALALGANDITTDGGTISQSDLDILQDGAIALASEVSGTLPVANGGTGATTLTDGGILLGSGTGAVTALGAAANGEIPIGDGTTDPVLATITGTASEITVTNGAGSITLSLPANVSDGIMVVDEEAGASLLYNGADKVYALAAPPQACASVQVGFNGYMLEQVATTAANNHFSCSGTTITLFLAPESGDHVQATYPL